MNVKSYPSICSSALDASLLALQQAITDSAMNPLSSPTT
jgi:hypothetical protein